jgi:hypothetical protein
MKSTINVFAAIAMSTVLFSGADVLAADGDRLALGTGFTYQGELEHEGAPADGVFDFEYELYDRAEGGTYLGRITRFDERVAAGVFSSELDFGTSITGVSMWLEIRVREAGAGPFTVLTPRQHLTKSVSSGCTVDSNLVVNGSVGASGDLIGFLDASGVEDAGFGKYDIFGTSYLTLRTNETHQVYVSGGGNVGIGTIPSVPLDVVGGTDASLSGGGYVVIGAQDGANIVIDNNEIIARNFTGQSPLYLNNDGGNVVTGSNLVVGGNLDFGYQRVVAHCGGGSQNWCIASCPAGKKVISGGCNNGSGGALWPINMNYPDTDSSWYCAWQAAVPNANLFEAVAICARVN